MTTLPEAAGLADPIVDARGIKVRYGQVEGLRGMDFQLARGEIHALVGEHRAGKSTLVRLLAGAVRPSAGTLVVDQTRWDRFSPARADRSGIGVVFQESACIPSLNAVENVLAGRQEFRRPFHHREAEASVASLFDRLGFSVDLRRPVGRLHRAEQHLVELGRALYADPVILVLDEVSNRLTPEEMDKVHTIVLDLRARGRSVVYVSHDLDEVFEFADRVTVMKDGCRRGVEQVKNIDRLRLVNMTYSYMATREELRRSNLELYNYKRYNDDIMRNLPVGVVILDSRGTLYHANPASLRVAGPLPEASSLFSAMEAPLGEEVQKSVRERRVGVWREVPFLGGAVANVSVYPFGEGAKETILLLEDVGAELSLKDYFVRSEKIASIAGLAAGVAHEVNNPLGIIKNYLHLLFLADLDAAAREKLTRVEREVDRIGDITRGLLSFSRDDSASFSLLDPAAAVDEAALLARSAAQERGVSFEWDRPRSSSLVRGNLNRLAQVFLNLIANAVDAAGQGGRVGVTLREEEGYAEILVSDDGPGVPSEYRESVFAPFFSTKSGGKNAGLGLAVCQHIVEGHDGILSLLEGSPTTFSVRLPVVHLPGEGVQ